VLLLGEMEIQNDSKEMKEIFVAHTIEHVPYGYQETRMRTSSAVSDVSETEVEADLLESFIKIV
jgi:hypothetical protein